LTICVPIYDPDILARGVASFSEPIMKGRQHVRRTSERSALEEPNHWHIEGCCPRAATGHATAAPPSSVMNARRLMQAVI
jgi:hypothetical protein